MRRDDGLSAPLVQPFAQRLAVVTLVGDEFRRAATAVLTSRSERASCVGSALPAASSRSSQVGASIVATSLSWRDDRIDKVGVIALLSPRGRFHAREMIIENGPAAVRISLRSCAGSPAG